jgi:hypothetical protein
VLDWRSRRQGETGCSTRQALVLTAFSVVLLRKLTGENPWLLVIFGELTGSCPAGATLSPSQDRLSTPFWPGFGAEPTVAPITPKRSYEFEIAGRSTTGWQPLFFAFFGCGRYHKERMLAEKTGQAKPGWHFGKRRPRVIIHEVKGTLTW